MYEWLDFPQIIERYPIKQYHLRSLMRSRKTNGLDKVVRKIGKKLVFRADLLEEWIEQQR